MSTIKLFISARFSRKLGLRMGNINVDICSESWEALEFDVERRRKGISNVKVLGKVRAKDMDAGHIILLSPLNHTSAVSKQSLARAVPPSAISLNLSRPSILTSTLCIPSVFESSTVPSTTPLDPYIGKLMLSSCALNRKRASPFFNSFTKLPDGLRRRRSTKAILCS